MFELTNPNYLKHVCKCPKMRVFTLKTLLSLLGPSGSHFPGYFVNRGKRFLNRKTCTYLYKVKAVNQHSRPDYMPLPFLFPVNVKVPVMDIECGCGACSQENGSGHMRRSSSLELGRHPPRCCKAEERLFYSGRAWLSFR